MPGRRRQGASWPSARPNCSPCPISMSCSPCRRRSPTSPTRIRRSSTDLAVQGRHSGADHHRGRPQASRCRIGMTGAHTWGSALTHHPHAHIIVPGDGSPTVSTGLPVDPTSFCRSGAVPPLPPPIPGEAGRCPRRRTSALLRRPCRPQPNRTPSRLISHHYDGPSGWSFRNGPSADPKPFSPTCPATRIGSPFLTAGSSPSTVSVSPSSGKTYRAKGAVRYKVMTLDADEFIRRFLIHVLPMASIASAITACSQMATVPTTSRAPVSCSVRQSPRHSAMRATVPMAAKKTGNGRLVHAAADAWSSSRPFERGCQPRNWPHQSIGIDSS